MTDQCMVLKTRRAARAVTRRYNELLKPFGIQSTQASLLSIIYGGGFDSISDLAEKMAIERSALTRNLKVLRDQGYITSDAEGRGRAQKVTLTRAGQRSVEKVAPLWIKAQDELRAELGEREWKKIQAALSTLANVA
eukprot:s1_g2149.t1